ncbi:KAP-like P-loop domain-containing protein [Kribbella steppae]|uniref:KAP-like P-loop domain-containing protein n=1 Tax=Kribbella steppae TaxID=2512223 RepID=A0A4R2HDK5_9ACTN|nr:P-loop NTPase fold protein [Kribbella steppae]TCO26409.1 KAP-like P-loop domain-containing protein [Kribbella steppae]
MGFFSDDPVDGADGSSDELERREYSGHLVRLLGKVSAESDSSVLAIIGPWGSGKSSILATCLTLLREDENWSVAEFNPWAYSDLDSMLLGFFSELSAALPESEQPKEIRKKIGGFVERISPVGKLGGLVGIDAESALSAVAQWVTGDGSASAERRKLEETLRSTAQPILVVLDDLDRLSPAELLLVFKLVRFLGRLPYVYYLLAYDEKTLIDVLSLTELCGGSADRARDYLEKMVQVRLDIPPLRAVQAKRFLLSRLEQLADDLGLTVDLGPDSRFVGAYENGLSSRLVTPRSINRYLAQVDALYSAVRDEVDFVDFCVLTYLRTFETPLYSMLFRLRSEVAIDTVRVPMHGVEFDGSRWADVVAGTRPDSEPADVEGLVAVLATLFPVVASMKSEGRVDSRMLAEVAARRGVGHSDYFDRYFSFGVPGDDLADSEISETLSQLGDLDPSDPSVRRLKVYLYVDRARAARKIWLRRSADPDNMSALVTLLGGMYVEGSDESSEGAGRRRTYCDLASRFTAELSEGDLLSLVSGLDDAVGWLLFGCQMGLRDASPRSVLADKINRFSSQLLGQGFLETPLDVKHLVMAWAHLDAPACRSWVRSATSDGGWDDLDIAGWWITTKERGSETVLDSFPEEDVERLLGIDYLIEKYAEPLNDAGLEQRDFANTAEGRRAAVLYSLRTLRDRRLRREEEPPPV